MKLFKLFTVFSLSSFFFAFPSFANFTCESGNPLLGKWASIEFKKTKVSYYDISLTSLENGEKVTKTLETDLYCAEHPEDFRILRCTKKYSDRQPSTLISQTVERNFLVEDVTGKALPVTTKVLEIFFSKAIPNKRDTFEEHRWSIKHSKCLE